MIPVSPITTDRPLRADAERNRLRILEAATELFASRGLEITLDDVADHAGVGVGTVYRRFASKSELIDGVFEHHMDNLAECADAALRNEDPWAGLLHFFEYACEQMAVNRGLGEVFLSMDEGRERVGCARERMTPAVQQLVQRARTAGVLRPDVEESDFFALSCMIEAIGDFTRPVAPEIWRRYFTLVIDGLRADGAQRTPLPQPALTPEQVDQAKTEHHCGRR